MSNTDTIKDTIYPNENINMHQDEVLKRYTLLVAATASFLTPFMGSSINLAIPSIAEQFNANALLIGWVATSYILATAAFLVPIGRLADIVGRKIIFMLGIAFFSISSLLCGMASTIEMLIAFRILQGIGSAFMFGTGMAILTSVYPAHERGKALGLNVAAVYIGLSLGPVLGGAMNHHLGWPSIFYFTAFLAAAVLLLAAYRLKGEWVGAKGERYDLAGAILYAVGLVTLMYGISSIAVSVYAKYILVFGLILMIMFVRHEMKVKYPVLNLQLFTQNMAFAFSNLASLINYSATFAIGYLISLHLQMVMGYNSQIAGFIYIITPVIMVIISPFAGKLSDRVEPRIIASLGMAITTLGLFMLTFITLSTPVWLLICILALLGTGFALFASPNSNAIMSSVEKRFYGVASSTLSTMRLTGQAISMALVTLILAVYVGNIELSQASVDALVKSIKTTFTVLTVICFGGVFASLARGNVKKSIT